MGIWRSFEAHSGLPELHLLLTSDPGLAERPMSVVAVQLGIEKMFGTWEMFS